jgi:hypothetical protein
MGDKKTVIFDLDGTLALVEDRRQLAMKLDGKINWGIFFHPSNIQLDKPNQPIIEMCKLLKSQGHPVFIFSGRDAVSRDKTVLWLEQYGIEFDLLKMRPQGSRILDITLKQLWIDRLFPDRSEILCAFDDRDKVVKMWRDNNVTCLQVAEGNF